MIWDTIDEYSVIGMNLPKKSKSGTFGDFICDDFEIGPNGPEYNGIRRAINCNEGFL